MPLFQPARSMPIPIFLYPVRQIQLVQISQPWAIFPTTTVWRLHRGVRPLLVRLRQISSTLLPLALASPIPKTLASPLPYQRGDPFAEMEHANQPIQIKTAAILHSSPHPAPLKTLDRQLAPPSFTISSV